MSNPVFNDKVFDGAGKYHLGKMPDGVGFGGYANTVTITSSGTWTAPKAGRYQVTCIGGGGGGGNGGYYNIGASGGGAGGTTRFGGYLASYGGPGGGGGAQANGGGGGGTGQVSTVTLDLAANESVAVTIGAGGAVTYAKTANADGTDGAGTSYAPGGRGGIFYQGGEAGWGGIDGISGAHDNGVYFNGVGGRGSDNGYDYGNGGGGGGGGGTHTARGGGARGNATAGADVPASDKLNGGKGGNGGAGAVIIEYN
jgi:hypothetical protein